MDANSFVYWLDGYLDSVNYLEESDIAKIRKNIQNAMRSESLKTFNTITGFDTQVNAIVVPKDTY